jgi:peptidoglycan hydrolase CwlO-like protein
MKSCFGLILLFTAVGSFSQNVPAASAAPGPPAVGSTSMTAVLPDLDRLQSAANQSATILGHMRIEKWKADNNTKQQAQQNADSIQRNVTAALPGMISAVRSAPQDLNAEFRLYRNVNVLYDVMGSLAESAGAFGPKNDFENLAQQLEIIDSVRHNLGDSVERLTASTEYELNQLRTQLRAAQERQVAPAAAPKTVVVDDNAPAKKTTTTHKKKTAASKPAASGDASGSSTPSNPSPPKQ